MKRILLITVLNVLSYAAFSQEVANLFLEKFNNDDHLEVISIGKKMFQMMADASIDDGEFNKTIKGLEKIIVISSTDSTLSSEYYDSACEILAKKKNGFETLLSTKDGKEELVVMSKESKGVIKELVLLQIDKVNNFSLISLSGDINLKTLAKYSEKINLSGLKVLDSISKNEN
ncbi:MAG: DUF4252 domain-containing protein [Dysgonamonadaceae bacterium]|jgi:hypothetical protein|nr:DUF4252 domain-containing protein [Dysgonamonadaceae bacterium]